MLELMPNHDPLTGEQKLLMLADVLDKVAPERFDLRMWVTSGLEPHECGFAACAVGTACLMPQFQALGLKMGNGCPYPRTKVPIFTAPDGKQFRAWDAVTAFFDLEISEALNLFSMEGLLWSNRLIVLAPMKGELWSNRTEVAVTPKEVAATIREHVAAKLLAAKEASHA